MEEKDKVIVKWAQEDVETSNNLLNNSNNNKDYCLLTSGVLLSATNLLAFFSSI